MVLPEAEAALDVEDEEPEAAEAALEVEEDEPEAAAEAAAVELPEVDAAVVSDVALGGVSEVQWRVKDVQRQAQRQESVVSRKGEVT